MTSGAVEGTQGRSEEPAWVRRRRLAAVFGNPLPETTADDRDDRPPADRERAAEDWLRDQVPPHHG